MTDLTKDEYDEAVEFAAECIIEEIEMDLEARNDPWSAIHDTVDYHEYVQEHRYYLDVLKHADSPPEEWQVYVQDDEDNHWRVLEAMVYTCFRQDVAHAVFDVIDQ